MAAVVVIIYGILYLTSRGGLGLGTLSVALGVLSIVSRSGNQKSRSWAQDVGVITGTAYAMLGIVLTMFAPTIFGVLCIFFGLAMLYLMVKPKTV